MSGAVFGGGMIMCVRTAETADEVGAVVFDIGTSTTKTGYAGEDTPKVRVSRQSLLVLLLISGCHSLGCRCADGGTCEYDGNK